MKQRSHRWPGLRMLAPGGAGHGRQAALRPYATAGIALVGASLIVVNPVAPPPPDIHMPAVQLTSGETDAADPLVALIYGGTSVPVPPPSYIQAANELYVQHLFPGAVPQGAFTPEGASPFFSGVKSLPLDTSVAQGTTIMDTDIVNQVAAGNTVVVYGESQSSEIAGFVMPELEQQNVPADAVKFILTAPIATPDGGLWSRFAASDVPGQPTYPELTLPALGITFNGATPSDTIYDTTIYLQEYDGLSDFPKYPLDLLSDINAAFGDAFVHPTYRDLTPQQIDDAQPLPTTPGFDGVTHYDIIPLPQGEDLPMLQLLNLIPVIGKPLADLLNPDLTVLVNLGYDNPNPFEGWDVGQANVSTPFDLFPPLDQVITKLEALGPATEQGIQAFVNDLSHLSSASSSLPDMSSPLTDVVLGSGTSASTDVASSPTDIINTLTGDFANAYALLLPTADTLTTFALTLPTYDVNLFLDNLNNPLDAIGLPIAADLALVSNLTIFGFLNDLAQLGLVP